MYAVKLTLMLSIDWPSDPGSGAFEEISLRAYEGPNCRLFSTGGRLFSTAVIT